MIKNQALAEQVLTIMNTMIGVVEELQSALENDKMEEFSEKGIVLFQVVKSIEGVADSLKKEEDGLNLPQAIASVKYSLARILKLGQKDVATAKRKLEFELLPLIQEMRSSFYFWGMVYPDEERKQNYYLYDIHIIGGNDYTKKSMSENKYKYDLSIIVLAYNKIEYTKKCLESLYRYLPENISYEIILVNHGSTDGTKELFELYHPNKQLDVAQNGGGASAVYRITEGKYVMMISNDVLVTKNAIENTYRCIDSDEKIAWVVPTTPNVSNFQTIPVQHTTFEEMEIFAEKNNVSDEYRWEQRVRLCNPIDIVRADFLEKTKTQYVLHAKNRMSFPDDKRSLICRRSGYKMCLAKDAYCFHFGSVTLKEDDTINSSIQYNKGRELFKQAYGIDPWTPSCCFSPKLIAELDCKNKNEVSILGVECGLGSNPLKIKEKIKENVHNTSCYIKNYLLSDTFLEDISGVSDEAYVINEVAELSKIKGKFDYIVDEYALKTEQEWSNHYNNTKALLKPGASLIMLVSNNIISNVLEKCKKLEKEVKTVANGRGDLWPFEYTWVILHS